MDNADQLEYPPGKKYSHASLLSADTGSSTDEDESPINSSNNRQGPRSRIERTHAPEPAVQGSADAGPAQANPGLIPTEPNRRSRRAGAQNDAPVEDDEDPIVPYGMKPWRFKSHMPEDPEERARFLRRPREAHASPAHRGELGRALGGL